MILFVSIHHTIIDEVFEFQRRTWLRVKSRSKVQHGIKLVLIELWTGTTHQTFGATLALLRCPIKVPTGGQLTWASCASSHQWKYRIDWIAAVSTSPALKWVKHQSDLSLSPNGFFQYSRIEIRFLLSHFSRLEQSYTVFVYSEKIVMKRRLWLGILVTCRYSLEGFPCSGHNGQAAKPHWFRRCWRLRSPPSTNEARPKQNFHLPRRWPRRELRGCNQTKSESIDIMWSRSLRRQRCVLPRNAAV